MATDNRASSPPSFPGPAGGRAAPGNNFIRAPPPAALFEAQPEPAQVLLHVGTPANALQAVAQGAKERVMDVAQAIVDPAALAVRLDQAGGPEPFQMAADVRLGFGQRVG
jgi:hypothetical protein